MSKDSLKKDVEKLEKELTHVRNVVNKLTIKVQILQTNTANNRFSPRYLTLPSSFTNPYDIHPNENNVDKLIKDNYKYLGDKFLNRVFIKAWDDSHFILNAFTPEEHLQIIEAIINNGIYHYNGLSSDPNTCYVFKLITDHLKEYDPTKNDKLFTYIMTVKSYEDLVLKTQRLLINNELHIFMEYHDINDEIHKVICKKEDN